MSTLYQVVGALWRGSITLPVRKGRTAAQLYLQRVRLQGYAAPVTNGTMFGPVLVCLRAQGENTVIVSDLWIAPEARGVSLGSWTLRMLTDVADEEGVTLRLRPQSFNRRPPDMTTTRLWRWYESRGFVRNRTWATRKPVASTRRAAA